VNSITVFPRTSSLDTLLTVMKFGTLHFPDVVVTDGQTDRQNGVLSGATVSNSQNVSVFFFSFFRNSSLSCVFEARSAVTVTRYDAM
jgi:chemotaxis response regulator CheB